ncbi:MAG: hypothetical protein HYZ14_10620 [Bacteroidetes bacterium]|nr:hypothetical protein [Bacteroidota bacterium]
MSDRSYTVEILNEPISFETISYLNSVKLCEYAANKKIREHKLGYLTKEDIYFNIERGYSINIDQAYVKDFSLSEYRTQRNLPATEKVVIAGISSRFTFFDCDSVIDFSYAVFEEEVNFKESIFPHGALTFMHAEFVASTVDFSECKFHSHNTTFEHASFKASELTFEHARFSGDGVSFINALFSADEVNFKRVNFGNARVKFHFAEFGNGVKLFERIRVNGALFDFRRVVFGCGKIDFRRAMFGDGYVTFEESEITEGKLTFRMARFEGGDLSFRRMDFGKDEATFDHVDFNNRSISFEGADLSVLSVSNSFVRGNLDLRIKKADKIDLSHSYLYSITDLNFQKEESLKVLSLLGVRNLGKIIIRWKENHVRRLIESNGGEADDLADQFNILKANFSANGQYNDEDYAYLHFKRHEHRYMKKRALEKSKPSFRPLIHLGYALRLLVFDKMGLYATNPARVLVSMVVGIFFFAAVYVLFHVFGIGEIVNSVDAADKLNLAERSVYHSAITFFTIGYGDFYPTGFSRLISALEGWSGVFLMSYFTVAFVRKILR